MRSIIKLPIVFIVFLLKIKRSRHRNLITCHCLFWTMIRLWIRGVFDSSQEKEISVKLFGMTITGYGPSVLLWLIDDIFVKEIYYSDLTEEKPLIIDCGANIGLSVLYFKYKYPNAAIWAFEPNSIAFKLLERNVEQNQLKDVTLHNVALSDKEGSIDFYVGDVKGSLISSIHSDRSATRKMIVRAELLSNYLQDKSCALMKIDVEGAEWQILRELISSKKIDQIDQVAMEFHLKNSRTKAKMGEFLLMFEENGFDYYLKADFEKESKYQDLFIYAKRISE